jgi:hypothetical protein
MTTKDQLKNLISDLRCQIKECKLTQKTVCEARQKLRRIGYEYDTDLFPPLPGNHTWDEPSLATPQSLSEALLWKMGKWEIYKSFVAHYTGLSGGPKKTDVVFYAFAQHLQAPSNPIYDQHALRALWAIDTTFTQEQNDLCRKLLAKRNGDWKPIASGAGAHDGYKLYVLRLKNLSEGDECASLNDLDKLLMPLGQALKEITLNISDFLQLTDIYK